MHPHSLQTWVGRRIAVRTRLAQVCLSYLLFLMVVTRKHSLEEAARFSGLNKSQFSKFLQYHTKVALSTLEALSKKQAKPCAKTRQSLQGLPWKIALVMDSTLQHRASLYPENAKKFNHGTGFVLGHQWTNIVLIINDILMPLQPIPFYSKRYCQEHALDYHTEHDLVVAYLTHLDLEESIGSHDPRDVLVLADSGYDDKKIETAILHKQWNFIIAVGNTRRVTSETVYLTTPKSRAWCHLATFFRNHRRLKWTTIRCMTTGAKRQRRACRIRHTMGSLRYVGKVHLVCSEPRKRPEGRRQYLACHDGKATARQLVLGYRRRWTVELFHTDVKRPLGCEDVATSGFDSVKSHVSWVYCPDILLHMSPPGVPPDVQSIGEKRRHIQQLLDNKAKRCVLQKLTQIGGVERYKDELRQALAGS